MAATVSTAQHAAGSQRSPKADWWMLGVLALLYMLSLLNRQIVAMLAPEMAAELALDDFQLGMLMGPAFGLIFAIVGLPLGWVADNITRKWLILFGCLLVGLATWRVPETSTSFRCSGAEGRVIFDLHHSLSRCHLTLRLSRVRDACSSRVNFVGNALTGFVRLTQYIYRLLLLFRCALHASGMRLAIGEDCQISWVAGENGANIMLTRPGRSMIAARNFVRSFEVFCESVNRRRLPRCAELSMAPDGVTPDRRGQIVGRLLTRSRPIAMGFGGMAVA